MTRKAVIDLGAKVTHSIDTKLAMNMVNYYTLHSSFQLLLRYEDAIQFSKYINFRQPNCHTLIAKKDLEEDNSRKRDISENLACSVSNDVPLPSGHIKEPLLSHHGVSNDNRLNNLGFVLDVRRC